MRLIGQVPGEQDAHRFGDYLLARGIKNSVEQGRDGWQVWVEDDDQVAQGAGELREFLKNPAEAKYGRAARAAAEVRKSEQQRTQKLRKRFVDVRTQWGQPRQWAQPLTLALVLAAGAVALVTLGGERMEPYGHALQIQHLTEEQWRDLMNQDVNPILYQVRHGQVWRLITPIFIHFGILHLVFNVLWLLDLGGAIERHKGSLFLAALVLITALLSNLAQYFWDGPNFGGLSGVMYALFGYLWMKGRLDPASGLALRQETVWLMIAWLFLCMTGWLGPVANMAHVAGLIIGVIAGATPSLWKRGMRKLRRA
jgi:GlpG protein